MRLRGTCFFGSRSTERWVLWHENALLCLSRDGFDSSGTTFLLQLVVITQLLRLPIASLQIHLF